MELHTMYRKTPYPENPTYWAFLTEALIPVLTWQKITFFKPTSQLANQLHGAESFLRPSANQEIPHILLNSKVHSHIQKHLPLLSLINLVCASQFLKIHFNIILPSMPRCSKWSLFPSYLPAKTLFAPCMSTTHATCPAHPILLDFITQ